MESYDKHDASLVGKDLAAVLPKTKKLWITQPHLLSLNARLLIPLFSSCATGFDGSMMNGLQALDSWNKTFGSPTGATLGLFNAVGPLGSLAFTVPASWISDKFGRKWSIIVGAIILVASAAMQGAAQNLATFILARFFIGAGIVASAIPAPVLISETAYPTHRGKITSLYNTFFFVGAIASSWSTYGTFKLQDTWGWRIPSILQAFFPLLQLIFIWSVPESPRWLVNKGRNAEARAILVKYHAAGDESSPLIDFEMREIEGHLELERQHAATGLKSLWATKADKKRLAVIIFIGFMAQWAGNGIISYYFALVLDSIGIKDSGSKTLLNGLFLIFNALSAWSFALLLDRVGRRRLWIFSMSGMLCSYIVFTACSATYAKSASKKAGQTVVAAVFMFYFFYDAALTPLTFAYPTEILPYHVRQKGIATVFFSTEIALLVNTYVNPIAMQKIAWKYYLVFIVILAVALLAVFFFFPETKGLPLEEISAVFDSNEKAWRKRKVQPTVLGLDSEEGEKDAARVEIESV